MPAWIEAPNLIGTHRVVLRARLVQPDLRAVNQLHLDGFEPLEQCLPLSRRLERIEFLLLHAFENHGALPFKLKKAVDIVLFEKFKHLL